MSAVKTWGWMAMGFGITTGCLEYPDALPPPLGSSSEGTASPSTLSATDTTAGVGTADETAGSIAECGNEEVEDGEECDGLALNEATCVSLGLSGAGLACVDCRLDASECGPPPGMVEVPGGVFEMGLPEGMGDGDEQPVRSVQVDTFWIDEVEVTVQAYQACVQDDEDPCSEPGNGASCNWAIGGRMEHPVNCVTWDQAEHYCAWAGGGTKRLPTEAEWEKAARGTDAREYAWGNSPTPSCSHVVMNDVAAGGLGCGENSTMPVWSKPLGVSPYGAYDMAGNVTEWVADWYVEDYDSAETDNPTGPVTGTKRVRRGGSWETEVMYLRAANRAFALELDSLEYVGIRCARTAPAS